MNVYKKKKFNNFQQYILKKIVCHGEKYKTKKIKLTKISVYIISNISIIERGN
jgi:hypothetical protein